MAQIGTTDKWKIYVVRKANDPPSTDNDFTDYSDYIMNWITKGAVNQLSYFEATLASIETTDEKLDISKGNLIYLMAGTKLVGKFIIGKPDYRTDFTVKISGYQSSGTEMINRKLANESMPKITYDNRSACYILNSTCNTCQGILVDGAENTILALNPSCYGTACPYSVKYDYENRITAVDKLVHKTGQEWWVDHGTNDATPYSEGDYLNVADKQGAVASSKTFYFTGDNQNAIISEGAEELETNANHVIMQGQNQRNMQVESIAYDSIGSYTCITSGKAIDGWLSSNITDNGTVIPLTSGSVGGVCDQLATYWAEFRIDDELIKATTITGDPPVLTGITRGFRNTEATPHKAGSDVSLWELGTGVSTPWENMKLCVDCPNCLIAPSCARIGTEIVCVNNICNTEGYACIERLNWDQVYAHGEDIWVKGANWNESNPENRLYLSSWPSFCCGSSIIGCTSGSTGIITAIDAVAMHIDLCNISGNFCCEETICQSSPTFVAAATCREYLINSIQQNGLFSKTFSDNTARNKNMLDKTAQRILLTKKSPIKRIVIEAAEPIEMWGDVDIGDTVTLGDGSEIGLSDGDEVRITGFEFSFDGFERLLLYCNDKETRTYPSTDVSYVKEQDQINQPKQQEATRTFGKQDTPSASCNCPSSWSESSKKVTNVLSPVDPFDVANKKYVDSQVTTFGGHWCCTPGELTPCYECYDILPNVGGGEVGQGACIGRPTNYWEGIYGATIRAISGFQGSGSLVCNVFGVISVCNPTCPFGYELIEPQTAPDPNGYPRGLCILGCNGICVCKGHLVDPTALVIDGSGIGGTGIWEDFSPTYMKPCESRSVYPKFANTCNIGNSACRWYNGYFNNLISTYACTKCVWADTRVRSPFVCGECVCASTMVCSGGFVKATGDLVTDADVQVSGDVWVTTGTVIAACYMGGNLGYGCVNKACIACNGLWTDLADPYICPSGGCSICGPTLIFNNVLADYVDVSCDIYAMGNICAEGILRMESGGGLAIDSQGDILPYYCGCYCVGRSDCNWRRGYFYRLWINKTEKTAILNTKKGIIILHCDESAETVFHDNGEGKSNKTIKIDPIFKEVTEKDYNILITPTSILKNSFWVQKKKNSFYIKSEDNFAFDWQITAIRKGFKGIRWKSKNPINLNLNGITNVYEDIRNE